MSKSLITENFKRLLQGGLKCKVRFEHSNELDWTDSDFDYLVSCPYNGGGHSEYASNIFSTIYGVKLGENDKIYLNTEDDEYEIEEVDTAYVYDLCGYIENVVFGEDEEEKE